MDRKKLIKKLKEFRKKIEKEYNLKNMILFGSRAKNKHKKDSDVDLIIVGEFNGEKNLDRAPPLYIYWEIDLPVDFLCYTPQEFNKLKNQITIVRDAVKEGIEII